MKLDAKDYFEFAGIAAVIVSLLFVAIELRQSNRIALAESETEFRARVIEIQSRVIENDAIADALVKLRDENPQLSDAEEEKIYAYVMTLQTNWQSMAAAYQNGMLSERSMTAVLRTPNTIIGRYPGLKRYFRQISDDYDLSSNPTAIWEAILEEID